MRLDGRVALITGAAGGVGGATAERMGREGASVILVDRDAARVERVAERVLAVGGQARAVSADVTDATSIDAAVRAAVTAFGKLDVLVVNAAIQLHGEDQPIPKLAEETWDRTLDVNLRGAFLTCRAGIGQMVRQRQGGAVVVVSSVTALVGVAPQNPAYTASKGGLLALGRALAIQHAPDGIRVNVVCPGALEAPPNVERLADPAARERRLSSQVPLGRLGRYDEIAPMIAFLASDDASYVSGQIIYVAGGPAGILM